MNNKDYSTAYWQFWQNGLEIIAWLEGDRIFWEVKK